MIKQQYIGFKSCFKVTKVSPDPSEMVFNHFWCIWGHLDALRQSYLVKTRIGWKPDFRGKNFCRFHRQDKALWAQLISQFLQPFPNKNPRNQNLSHNHQPLVINQELHSYHGTVYLLCLLPTWWINLITDIISAKFLLLLPCNQVRIFVTAIT